MSPRQLEKKIKSKRPFFVGGGIRNFNLDKFLNMHISAVSAFPQKDTE
jgi:hypothetical protein